MPTFLYPCPWFFCMPLLHAQKNQTKIKMAELPRQSRNTVRLSWSIKAVPRESGEEMNGKGSILFWPLRQDNSSSGRFHYAPLLSLFPYFYLWAGWSEEGKLYEDPTGSYAQSTFSVHSTAVTLGNYPSNKLPSMVFFVIIVLLVLPHKNHGKRIIPV